MPARPPVSFLMTPSLKPRSLSMSIFGAANVMPWSAERFDLVHHARPCAAAPSTGCSRRSGTRRRASRSARPAPSSCRGRRSGRRPSSRRGRRPAPASRIRRRPCRRSCRRAGAGAGCALRRGLAQRLPAAGAAGAARLPPAQRRQRGARALSSISITRTFAHLVAELDLQLLHDAGVGRRNLHRRLVGLDA